MADPQFCLLAIDHWATCMSRAEWSGWVQAVGSVGALVGIWYTVRRQRQLTIAAEERARRNAEAQAWNAAQIAVGTVSAILEVLRRDIAAGVQDFRIHGVQLEEGLLLAQAVPVVHLPFPKQPYLLALRHTATTVVDCITSLKGAGSDRSRMEARARLAFVLDDQVPKVHNIEKMFS